MKNLGSDGERVKSFIFFRQVSLYFHYIFSSVLCATDFFQFLYKHNLVIPQLVLPASKQKHYRPCGYKLLSGTMVRIKQAHVFLKFVRRYTVFLVKVNQAVWVVFGSV